MMRLQILGDPDLMRQLQEVSVTTMYFDPGALTFLPPRPPDPTRNG
jgi:hypothetical protein